MKILMCDSSHYFITGGHEVYTVRDMQWNDIKNGRLLELLRKNQFDCWIVVDKNIPYQQNVTKLPCTVVVLDILRNTLAHIVPLFSDILTAIEKPIEEKVVIISERKNDL